MGIFLPTHDYLINEGPRLLFPQILQPLQALFHVIRKNLSMTH